MAWEPANPFEDQPPLSVRDRRRVLEAVTDLADAGDVLLVGGQALAFWCERYADLNEELSKANVASKDIDFYGGPESARVCAERLPGKPVLAEPFSVSPNTGVVTFEDECGFEREVDFLRTVYGLSGDLRKAGIVLVVDEDTHPQLVIRVLHPILVLRSRTANVVGLPGQYDTPHGRNQLRAAIHCAREYIYELLEAGHRRHALKNNEDIFRFASRCDYATKVYEQRGIDVAEAIVVDDRLGEKFMTIRYPQMVDQLERRRTARCAAKREA